MNQGENQLQQQTQDNKELHKDRQQENEKEVCNNEIQNNLQYIPKEQKNQRQVDDNQIKNKQCKYEHEYEYAEQNQSLAQKKQQTIQDQQQQNRNQYNDSQNYQQKEQKFYGERSQRNKHSGNFEKRDRNYQYQQKQNVKQNYESVKWLKQQKGYDNEREHSSHINNQPLNYPEIRQENDNNADRDNINANRNENDNNEYQEKQNINIKSQNNNIAFNYDDNNDQQFNKNKYQQNNHHIKQYDNGQNQKLRRDRNPQNYVSSNKQNNQFNNKKFNQNNNNEFNHHFDKWDDKNSMDDDYYYKKDNRNQREKQYRRKSDDFGLKEFQSKDDDNKIHNRKFKNQKKGQRQKNKQKNQDFEFYWTQEQIDKGKAENEIFEGIFIANEFTREKSNIKCPIFKKKVRINSFYDTNRAIHGALVAFKIIKIQKKNQLETEDEFDEEITEQIPKTDITVQNQVENNQEKVEGEQNDEDWVDIDGEDDNISKVSDVYVVKKKVSLTKIQKLQKVQLVGKVVGIVKNPIEKRQMIGKLCFDKKERQQNIQIKTKEDLINYIEQNYYVSFKCVNKRMPFFKIKNLLTFNYELDNQQPVEKFIDYATQRYFSAQYKQWFRTFKYPDVELIKEVGVQGNIEVECEAILTENSVYDNEFSEQCKEEMKAFTHDSIATERVNRLDLTKEYICSIDPVTARDLDDALSINDLGNGIYEIGVHIADVSHFVIPNSEVDKEAILRTTSVYLVHKVIPMLPRILCEELCSLNRDVERLAFSVFFKMTSDGEVLWDSFRAAKSVIKSCAQLSYDIVNQLIDGQIEQFSQGEERYKVADGFDENVLKNKVLLLNAIAQKRREKRLEGSLTFEKSKLRFILNPDLFPNGYTEENRGLAQFMVEEWMLLANQFVGKKLVQYDFRTAILRQHISPKEEKLDYYRNLLEACGLKEMAENLDVSTSRNLKLTMQKVNEIESQEIKLILGFRLLKLMEAAQYFVVDDTPEVEWRHYALDFDVYTHFTSPIRRYPDILVHRRLQIALEQQDIDQTGETRDKLKAIMQHCNDCKLNARRVSDQCDQLFLALLLKANPVVVDAYILSINRQQIEVIIPKFNLERKVEFKNFKNVYKISVEEIEENKQELIVSYNDPDDEKGVRLYFVKQFQQIKIKLSGTDTFPIEYQIQIIINNKVLI